MHKPLVTLLILACASPSLVPAVAKDKEPAAAGKPSKEDSKDTDKGGKEEDIKLPPFPADKSVPQSMTLDGHGWDDLSCPFMASVLIVDQMPLMGTAQRVQVKEYPGGHMCYSRTSSQAAMRGDVMKMYAAH